MAEVDDELITLLKKAPPPKSLEKDPVPLPQEELEDKDLDEGDEFLEEEDPVEVQTGSGPPSQLVVIEPELKNPDVAIQLPKSQLIEKQDEDTIGMTLLLKKFGITAEEIINNYAKDRAQIDEGITLLSEEIKKLKSEDNKIPAALLEAWTKLLAAKAEINMSATSSLDSIAKLLAAGKGNELIISMKSDAANAGELNLEALLSQAPRDDELKRVMK